MKFASVILCMLVSMAVAQLEFCAQSETCLNGGTCFDDGGIFCLCLDGYTGTRCEVVLAPLSLVVTVDALNEDVIVFSTDLLNVTSDYFREFEKLLCNAFSEFILIDPPPSLRTIECSVLSFVNGSVIGNMKVDIGVDTAAEVISLAIRAHTELQLVNDVLMLTSGENVLTISSIYVAINCTRNPCRNDGTCQPNGCLCLPGYNGTICEMGPPCLNITIDTEFGEVRLPVAEVGVSTSSTESCPVEDSEALDTPIIRAICQIRSNGTTPFWNTSIGCEASVTTLLEDILKAGITEANLNAVSQEVFNITLNYDDINPTDVALIYEILLQISDLNSTDANVTDLIVGIVNNVMFVEEDVLASAQENGNSTTLIVQILESQLNTVYVANSTLKTAYPNIAAHVLDLPSDTAGDGIVVTMFSMDTGDLSNSDIMVGTHQDTPIGTVQRDTFARVVVPIEVAQVFTAPEATEGPSGSNNTSIGEKSGTTTTPGVSSSPEETVGESTIDSLRITFVVYVNNAMFPSQILAQLNQETQKVNRQVNTPVVSLTVGGQKIENLMERVNITFSRFEPNSRDPTCNFWEFSLGKWSMTGCQLLLDNATVVNSLGDEYYICACDHLTNFAVLVDIYAVDEPPTPMTPVLRLLSIIGCAISCVCLVIAIVSYLTVKKVRKSQTHKIFICLCATLLCLYIASLAIIALDTEYQYAELEWIPCTVLAALVHFFVLSSLTWMGIEGFNTYLMIIRVFDTYIPRFMIKAAIVGWGIPAVIVGATGGITRNTYAVEDYCYIRKWPLIGGLLVPMAIILIINICVFILAICRLEQSARMAGRVKKDRKAERKETVERIQNGITILVLLGFTWTTGYLTLINVDIADLLFIVSNSLQGFFIFVLYCLRKANIRKQWRRCICCALSREVGRGTGGTQPMSESESPISHTNPAYSY